MSSPAKWLPTYIPHVIRESVAPRTDLRELQKWPLAFRGEKLLHLLHTSYATAVQPCWPALGCWYNLSTSVQQEQAKGSVVRRQIDSIVEQDLLLVPLCPLLLLLLLQRDLLLVEHQVQCEKLAVPGHWIVELP